MPSVKQEKQQIFGMTQLRKKFLSIGRTEVNVTPNKEFKGFD